MLTIDEYKILFDKYYKNFFIEILNNNILNEELKNKTFKSSENYMTTVETIINNIFKKL